MAIHEIDFDGEKQKICHDCVDEIWMGGKPDKLKKLGHSHVYRTKKSEEYQEEVEGTVLEYGGKEFSIVPVIYPCGMVSVSSLGSFLSVGYFSKPSHPCFPLSIRARHIQEYFKNKRGKKRKFINPQKDKARHE